MNTKETINLNLSSDKNQENTELLIREEIKETPFYVITTEAGSFGVLGKYRITEPNEDKNEIIKELKKITWNRIIQVMLIINETNK